jgi:hypothetical protein
VAILVIPDPILPVTNVNQPLRVCLGLGAFPEAADAHVNREAKHLKHGPQRRFFYGRGDSLRATATHHHRKTLSEVTGDDDRLPTEGDFGLHEVTEECVQPVEVIEVHHRSLIPQ